MCPLSTDVTLTVDHVMKLLVVLDEARDKWYFIGQALGVKDADLKEMENRHLPDKTRCMLDMLTVRVQHGGLTRSILCHSLRGKLVNRHNVANKIETLELNA